MAEQLQKEEEVAEKLGVSPMTISNWESETQPQIFQPAKIADWNNANNSQETMR
ncbi:MAG: helix-turn-helix domain-containing protein [Thermocrinis sp.]|uniref:helix-turn-helix domain-containing protein n=1 Tax=Thermocrinis sp. TaxID=2024383 RepID=UPI003BFB8F4D